VCFDTRRYRVAHYGLVWSIHHTGQRLKDLAELTWREVDLQKREVSLQTRKTKRRQIIPLSSALVAHLTSLPSSDNPDTPIMPRCAATSGSTLSRQFGELLVLAGLIKRETSHHKPENKANKGNTKAQVKKDARRVQSEITFHSLRHTATSLLKNAGASDAVAREIIGHDSEAISRGYTHIETDTLRKAVDAMPDILAKPAATPSPPKPRR